MIIWKFVIIDPFLIYHRKIKIILPRLLPKEHSRRFNLECYSPIIKNQKTTVLKDSIYYYPVNFLIFIVFFNLIIQKNNQSIKYIIKLLL